MDDLGIQNLIEKHKDSNGLLDLEKMMSSASDSRIKSECFIHNGKKLTKFVLPSGMKFYAKPTSYRGASAEKVVTGIYQIINLKVPNVFIATFGGNYYTLSSDIFTSKNIHSGESFLKKITPAGAQYALPLIFGKEIIDKRAITYFNNRVLKQIAEHYALALATKNWDANIGGLGFVVDNKEHAIDLIAYDFGGSLEEQYLIGYANPFYYRRINYFEMISYYQDANKSFIKRNEIIKKVRKSVESIDDIVYLSKNSGFNPDSKYVDDLKSSMYDFVNVLQI